MVGGGILSTRTLFQTYITPLKGPYVSPVYTYIIYIYNHLQKASFWGLYSGLLYLGKHSYVSRPFVHGPSVAGKGLKPCLGLRVWCLGLREAIVEPYFALMFPHMALWYFWRVSEEHKTVTTQVIPHAWGEASRSPEAQVILERPGLLRVAGLSILVSTAPKPLTLKAEPLNP